MRLLERVAAVGVRRRLARATIACYGDWIVRFLRFSRGAVADARGAGLRRPAIAVTSPLDRLAVG